MQLVGESQPVPVTKFEIDCCHSWPVASSSRPLPSATSAPVDNMPRNLYSRHSAARRQLRSQWLQPVGDRRCICGSDRCWSDSRRWQSDPLPCAPLGTRRRYLSRSTLGRPYIQLHRQARIAKRARSSLRCSSWTSSQRDAIRFGWWNGWLANLNTRPWPGLCASNYLQSEAKSRSELLTASSAFDTECQELLDALMNLTQRAPTKLTPNELRTKANSLVLRATQAALTPPKAAALSATAPSDAGRRKLFSFSCGVAPKPFSTRISPNLPSSTQTLVRLCRHPN